MGFWATNNVLETNYQLHTSRPKNSQLAHSDTDMSVHCRAMVMGFTYLVFLCVSVN